MESPDLTELSPKEAKARLVHNLARLVLATFIFTFIIARILVIFIMAGKLPPEFSSTSREHTFITSTTESFS